MKSLKNKKDVETLQNEYLSVVSDISMTLPLNLIPKIATLSFPRLIMFYIVCIEQVGKISFLLSLQNTWKFSDAEVIQYLEARDWCFK